VEPGSQGGGFFDDEAQLVAAIEREIGPDAAQATRRSRRLARSPRALTDAECVQLRVSLEPILSDMRSTGVLVPAVLEELTTTSGLTTCPPGSSRPAAPVRGSWGRKASASRSACLHRNGWPNSPINCGSGKSRSLPPPDARRPGRSVRNTPVPTHWPPRSAATRPHGAARRPGRSSGYRRTTAALTAARASAQSTLRNPGLTASWKALAKINNVGRGAHSCRTGPRLSGFRSGADLSGRTQIYHGVTDGVKGADRAGITGPAGPVACG
jgi:hypothetical protein